MVHSLFSKDADTAVAALRAAWATSLHGYERMVRGGINRNAMRVRIGGNVLQPEILDRVDYAQHWSVRHIARRHIVSIVARVEPHLVNAADIFDGSEDVPRSSIDDVFIGRNAWPSWSAQPTRKLLPGPWTTLVGMQSVITKVLTTTGPLGFPSRGSISSMAPTLVIPMELEFDSNKWPVLGFQTMPPKPAGDMAPAQLAAGEDWLQKVPIVVSSMGP